MPLAGIPRAYDRHALNPFPGPGISNCSGVHYANRDRAMRIHSTRKEEERREKEIENDERKINARKDTLDQRPIAVSNDFLRFCVSARHREVLTSRVLETRETSFPDKQQVFCRTSAPAGILFRVRGRVSVNLASRSTD